MEFSHISVLLNESVDGLAVKENGIYVDGTAGGGGHSGEILNRLKNGKLISVDRDPDAIATLTQKFKNNENSIIVKGNFADIKELLLLRGIGAVDGVCLTSAYLPTSLTQLQGVFRFMRTPLLICV